MSDGPRVAVLCAPPRGRAAASAVALALADARGVSCALAGAVGVAEGVGGIGGAPAARRAAARLRAGDLRAGAVGRLVWVADRAGAIGELEDVAAVAAAASAELARAAAIGAPAALALPFGRTPGLDRVLAWHDAIVVMREPGVSDAMLDRALTSLARLGRPVAAMALPIRLSGWLADRGLRTPREAALAVARLGLGDGAGGRGG
jgi:hypothetical protein